LEAVKSFKVDGIDKLTWEKVEGATHYYVYMNEYEQKEVIDGIEKTLKKDTYLSILLIIQIQHLTQQQEMGKYYIRAAGPQGSHHSGTNYD